MTQESKYRNALAHATDKEKTYMANPTRKNYKWVIVAVTLLIIGGAGYYFYKH